MLPFSSLTAKTILAVLLNGSRICARTWSASAIPRATIASTSAAVRPVPSCGVTSQP